MDKHTRAIKVWRLPDMVSSKQTVQVLETGMNKFDVWDIKNVKVYLNSDRYPYDNVNINIYNNHFAPLYEIYAQVLVVLLSENKTSLSSILTNIRRLHL